MEKSNRVPKYCFEIWRINHPDDVNILDVEIELDLQLTVREIVLSFTQCFDNYLKDFGNKDGQLEKRQKLKDVTITELQSRLLPFTNLEMAFEALCGSELEITNFLNREQDVFIEIFKEFVKQNMNISMQYFVNCFADFSSIESLTYSHKIINKMCLETRASLGSRDEFDDRIKRIVIENCEHLLEFYDREFDRKIREKQFKDSVHIVSSSKEIIKVIDITSKVNDITAESNIPSKSKEKVKADFQDLFIPDYKDHIEMFIRILREVTPKLINTDNHWIGPKNAARIYVEALKVNGIIRAKTTHSVAHNTLDKQFPNLGLAFMRKSNKETKADAAYSFELNYKIQSLKSSIMAKSR